MANMIHFMDNGGHVKARKFHKMMTDIHFDINWIEVFNRTLRDKDLFPKAIFKKLDPNSFDVLKTPIPWNYPTIVQLEGNCGFVTHSIGLMGNVIFDSSNDYTLERSIENLNHACRSQGGFRKIFTVAQLDYENQGKKRRCSKTKQREKYEKQCKGKTKHV